MLLCYHPQKYSTYNKYKNHSTPSSIIFCSRDILQMVSIEISSIVCRVASENLFSSLLLSSQREVNKAVRNKCFSELRGLVKRQVQLLVIEEYNRSIEWSQAYNCSKLGPGPRLICYSTDTGWRNFNNQLLYRSFQ